MSALEHHLERLEAWLRRLPELISPSLGAIANISNG